MARTVEMAFESHGAMLPLEQLLPLRVVTAAVRQSEKYRCITAALKELGLIEPLVVHRQKGRKPQYLVLDGHLRLDILRSQGAQEAFCLLATDDEAYTYNHKVSQVSPIQEHFMIMKAVENGIPEERIAATLNVNVANIRQKMNLLDGICQEAVALLKDRRVSAAALREIRRVAPMRQIEIAELMLSANNLSGSYARLLYVATSEEQRVDAEKPADSQGLQPEDKARMQREMQDLKRNFKMIEATHTDNVLHLVLAIGYLKSLLNNVRVVRYLSQHWPDILGEFQKIVESPGLDAGAAARRS
jgi:ParB-like chromosome segregation protein Spo0J